MKKNPTIAAILKRLEHEENFVFLETARPDAQNYLSYLFLRPEGIISTFKINEVDASLAQLDKALKDGYYVAGFLSYEAQGAFEEKLKIKESFDFPLLWFGLYKQPLIYNHRKKDIARGSWNSSAEIKEITPNISEKSYLKAITKIKDLISQGLTYQVNYTFKLKFSFSGSPLGLYFNLRDNQSVPYSALIKAKKGGDAFHILSFSPELFFRKKGNRIYTRPMKGTAQRGKTPEEDAGIAATLKKCPKNRSENLMIVDLLRNDLGRISKVGSVRVPHLFDIEKYQTLFQMTSTVEGHLKEKSAFDIFRHIFPSGSVTGAPKIKTMELIGKLEKEPRNIYTGSIGFFSPDNCGAFNVAIRTLLIDSRRKAGELGVGGGIVYDSDPRGEYAECRLKADFLVKRQKEFQLIETMLWQPDKGYFLLNEHLKRLENSAKYFNFLYRKEDVLKALEKLQNKFGRNRYKVRLLLHKDAKIEVESSLLKSADKGDAKIFLCRKSVCSDNPFLYHKTTNRKMYEQEYKRAKDRGFYDAIFINERNEITEGAISNIFIKKRGRFYTPPVACGLLDGVYRTYLCKDKPAVEEKILFKKDLMDADEIYLSNSVRGLVRVNFQV